MKGFPTALVILLAAAVLPAQETRGVIFGRIYDPQKSAVLNAAVAVINVETNTVQRTSTNETGYYEVPYLLPGGYEVTAEAAGFKKGVRRGITLSVSSRAEVDFILELGAVAETVSVTAEAPLLDTSTVSSGRVLDNRQVMDLPVFGNSVILLIKLTPGMHGGGNNNYLGLHSNVGGSDYYMAGSVGGNEWSIDGVPINGNSRRVAYLPYSDTVQEFKVETAGFDASIGHTTGANISMMTKSGANLYHGTLTEQHWQQRWNGTPFFTNKLYWGRIHDAEARGDLELARRLRSEPRQTSGHSNNYAATIGGPVRIPKIYNGRDRLFFFFSYNGFQDRKPEEPSAINRTVPTMSDRQGDFAYLAAIDPIRYTVHDPLTVRADPARATHYLRDPFPNNRLPASRMNANPLYAAYTKIFPVPNNNPGPGQEPRNNYLATGTPFNWDYDAFSNRVDYTLTEKHKFFGRWSWNDFLEDRGDWTYETARGLHTNGLNRHNLGATVDYVYTLNPTTILNFAVAGNEFREGNIQDVPRQFKPSEVGLPAYVDQKAGPYVRLPQVAVDGYEQISGGFPGFTRYRAVTAKTDISMIRKSHSLTAGFDGRGHFRTSFGPGTAAGSFSFNNSFTRRNDDGFTPAGTFGLSWAAFILGTPNGMSVATNDSYATHNPYRAFFVQDTWRVNSKLSLTLGLRVEFEGGVTERYNRELGSFDPQPKVLISDAAEAAYRARPLAERPASDFVVRGGSRYLGSEGYRRELNQPEWMYLPRLGLAYQLNKQTVLRAGYGRFFDTNNVLNNGPDQFGFSRGTSTTLTTDFGVNWLAGDPRNGVSPLRDPFPVRSDGTRFNLPTRDTLGLMARAGRGFGFVDYNWAHARSQRWRFGVQRQIGAHMVLDAGYTGSYTDRVSMDRRLDTLPGSYWADGLVRRSDIATNLNQNVTNPFNIANFASLAQSAPLVYQDMSTQGFFTSGTIRKHQLLRPFPHINGLTNNRVATGEVRTDALEVSFEKRFSHGVQTNVGYAWTRADTADFYANEFDEQPTWRPSNNARPHRLVVSNIWELPFGKSRRWLQQGWLSKLAGGWQIGTSFQYQPGGLLGWGNVFFYGSDVNPIARHGSERTLDRWFNTEGFERLAARGPDGFHRRVFPTRISGLRSDSTKQLDMNLIRSFKMGERFDHRFRLDLINAPNHPQFSGPDTGPFSTNFGRVTSQTATTRWIQLQYRLQF